MDQLTEMDLHDRDSALSETPPGALPRGLQSIATPAETGAAPGYEPGHVYRIRPDAYVAMSTRSGDATAILAALRRIGVG